MLEIIVLDQEQYNKKEILKKLIKRPSFSNRTRQEQKKEKVKLEQLYGHSITTDICHTVSFDKIRSKIINWLTDEINKKQFISFVKKQIYLNGMNHNEKETFNLLIANITKKTIFISPNKLKAIQQLAQFLNESKQNLSPGDRHWNRSIGYGLDPHVIETSAKTNNAEDIILIESDTESSDEDELAQFINEASSSPITRISDKKRKRAAVEQNTSNNKKIQLAAPPKKLTYTPKTKYRLEEMSPGKYTFSITKDGKIKTSSFDHNGKPIGSFTPSKLTPRSEELTKRLIPTDSRKRLSFKPLNKPKQPVCLFYGKKGNPDPNNDITHAIS